MKKATILLALALISLHAPAQTAQTKQPEHYTIIFTPEELQATLNVIDASMLAHNEVKDVENLILKQYLAQQKKSLADTSAKAAPVKKQK